jgi:hypothetical protein
VAGQHAVVTTKAARMCATDKPIWIRHEVSSLAGLVMVIDKRAAEEWTHFKDSGWPRDAGEGTSVEPQKVSRCQLEAPRDALLVQGCAVRRENSVF